MAPTLSIAALLAAFLAAFAGSVHCIAMCGPLRLLLNGEKKQPIFYQLGRLLAYLFLGFILSFTGAHLPGKIVLPLVVVVLLAHYTFSFPWISKGRAQLLLLASFHPFLLGAASGLLPCGLLHFWLGLATASRDPILGTALLFMLWLGTLPALEVSCSLLRNPILKAQKQYPRLVTGIFILIALLPVIARAWQEAPPKEASALSSSLNQVRCH